MVSTKLITPKYIKGYGKDLILKVRTIEIDNESVVWAGTSDGIILKFNNHKKAVEAYTLETNKNIDACG